MSAEDEQHERKSSELRKAFGSASGRQVAVRRLGGQVGGSDRKRRSAFSADLRPRLTACSAVLQILDHPLAAAQLSRLRARPLRLTNFVRRSTSSRSSFSSRRRGLGDTRQSRWKVRWPPSPAPSCRVRSCSFQSCAPAWIAGRHAAVVPEAGTGHIGLYRDPGTLRPVKYFSCLPANLAEAQVLVLDPMLATGHSAVEAVSIVKRAGATRVQLVCVLACPPGLDRNAARASRCPDHRRRS